MLFKVIAIVALIFALWSLVRGEFVSAALGGGLALFFAVGAYMDAKQERGR